MKSAHFDLKALKSIKKDITKIISKAKVKGINNIQNELAKRNIEATVTCAQEKNTLKFKIEPKAQKITTEDLSPKEAAKMKQLLGPIPLEMFNQEVSQNKVPNRAVSEAIERTQKDVIKNVNKLIKNIY